MWPIDQLYIELGFEQRENDDRNRIFYQTVSVGIQNELQISYALNLKF